MAAVSSKTAYRVLPSPGAAALLPDELAPEGNPELRLAEEVDDELDDQDELERLGLYELALYELDERLNDEDERLELKPEPLAHVRGETARASAVATASRRGNFMVYSGMSGEGATIIYSLKLVCQRVQATNAGTPPYRR